MNFEVRLREYKERGNIRIFALAPLCFTKVGTDSSENTLSIIEIEF